MFAWGIWLMLAVLFHGCAGGLYTDGYETYLDANGDVVRAYPAPYDQTVQAGVEALADIDGTVSSRRTEGYETIVQARSADGSPMSIRFIEEGRNLTVVKVRTGRIGLISQEYSNQLHVYLAERLKRSVARATPSEEPAKTDEAITAEAVAGNAPPKAAVQPPPTIAAQKSTPPQQKTPPAGEIPEPPQAASRPPAATEENSAPPDADRDAPEEVASLTDPLQPPPDYVIFFNKDSNIPPPEALAVLDQAARRIRANPDIIIAISGHADPEEDPAPRHLVSESRTLAVKSYLIGSGIAPGRIRTTWHGSRFAHPALEDKSQERRVEIHLQRGL